jgi:peptidoglycan hydrolase-like protein with peptidoglycan-binding domain
MWAALTVIMGWDVAKWRASLPAAPKPPVVTHPKPPAGLPVHKLGSRTLRNTSPDMTGTDILTYQKFIKGYLRSAPDGWFGDDTERATRAYQDMRGYHVDGVAGPQTLGPIVKALS